MKDSIIAGNGASRYLKSGIPAGTVWGDALNMLRNGTFPIDLNGVNPSGFTQLGTPVSKTTLLTDETAEKAGLTDAATVNDVLGVLLDVLTVTDRSTGERFFASLTVTDDGFPALAFTQI